MDMTWVISLLVFMMVLLCSMGLYVVLGSRATLNTIKRRAEGHGNNRTAQQVMNSDYPQPIVIPPDWGKVLRFMGVKHKLTRQQTGGAYYLFEFEFDPESGNRLHVHRYEDEVVYVLEGAIQIRLGDERFHRLV